MKNNPSSWEESAGWYDQVVGEKGHYYHQQVILPNLIRLLDLNKPSQGLLDLGCGQGILERHIPQGMAYLGIDVSPSLIKEAKKRTRIAQHEFLIHDLMDTLNLPKKDFTSAVCILAIQNMEQPLQLFKNASDHLQKNGKLVLVLNHPCFRIPRQSSWGIDQQKKIQYRRIDHYLSPMKIPIQTHPGKQKELETWSYHFPISSYSKWLFESGFNIETMEEWCSDKVSTGKNATMENRSRKEIPLFLAIVARKN